MAIKKATELDFSNKKVAVLLTGRSNIGKTTLALSAKRPLLIDLEDGVDRVEACYRKDVMTNNEVPFEQRYDAFVKDLTESDLSDYDTVIVDTLDKLFDLLVPVVIKENGKNAQNDGRTLSLKGYGAVGKKIADFIDIVKNLGKNVVLVAHTNEKADGDVTKIRLAIPGSTKDTIWNDIDLGGYIEYIGKDRVIGFSPTERYDAKGVHGVKGVYKIPNLKTTAENGKPEDNNFLASLIDVVINDLNSTNEQYKKDLVVYKKAVEIVPNIQNCQDVDTLNALVEQIKTIEHALTSRKELLVHVGNKANELGAKYDKETGKYIASA